MNFRNRLPILDKFDVFDVIKVIKLDVFTVSQTNYLFKSIFLRVYLMVILTHILLYNLKCLHKFNEYFYDEKKINSTAYMAVIICIKRKKKRTL